MKKILILFVAVIAALYACKDEAAEPTPATPSTPGGMTKSSAKAITKYYTYALDAQTGAKKWQYEEKYNKPLSSATIANETVYVSYSDSEAGVIGINAANGARIWNFKAEATYQPCVVDKSGKVYRGGISGIVK